MKERLFTAATRYGPCGPYIGFEEVKLNKPHKHAGVIKAWADGAEVQYRFSDIWLDATYPIPFSETIEYRIKPVPHKWQKEMDAQARGEVVECRLEGGSRWNSYGDCNFIPGFEYRIKPKDKTFEFHLCHPRGGLIYTEFRQDQYPSDNNIRCTFDPDTGALKTAEVLK